MNYRENKIYIKYKGGYMVTFEDVVNNPEVKELIKNAQKQF